MADYVTRMQTGQDKIYYVVGESLAAARSHPAIEALLARNVEVLLLGRRIDAWVMDHLQDFEGKKLKDATRWRPGSRRPGERRRQGKDRGATRGEQGAAQASQGFPGPAGLRGARQHAAQGLAAVLAAGDTICRRPCDVRSRLPVRRPASAAGAGAQCRPPPGEGPRETRQRGRVRRAGAGVVRTGGARLGMQLPARAFVHRLNRLWTRLA